MKKTFKGNGFFLILLLVLVVSLYLSSVLSNNRSNDYNSYNLMNDIEEGTVDTIVISQDQQRPSGRGDVVFKDQSEKYYYGTKVQEREEKLNSYCIGQK